jgi:Cu/Zn superoxide dismutase
MEARKNVKSDAIKKGPARAPARAMLRATGLTPADLEKPLVAVVHPWTDLGPCNFSLRALAEEVKAGIREAGGTPFEFGTIAISDGISMGTDGMRASLVSREVIADSIELAVSGHALDAVVALCGCQSPKEPGGAAALPGGGNVEAKFVGTGGSAANGSAVLHEVPGGVDIAIWLGGTGPGQFRVAVHATGNCSSANAFSAGPPWSPPGVPLAVVPLFKNDDTRTLTARLPGYRIWGPDGIAGRSVVVHAGASGSLEAQPGVPNNRIACGVIATPEPMFQRLGI